MSSSGVAQRLATGSPSPSVCDVLFVNENPSAPASIAGASSARIASICSGLGGVADRVAAHHVAADRAVADEEPGVDGDVAVQPVEVLGERLPIPVGAVLERGERHAFDLGHHLAEVVGVAGHAAAPA